MKKAIILLAVIFFATTVALPAFAQDQLPPDPNTVSGQSIGSPPGELIILDALVFRPLGLAAMGIGAIGAAVAAPWAASSHSQARVDHELLQKPYAYTFCRPLGDLGN